MREEAQKERLDRKGELRKEKQDQQAVEGGVPELAAVVEEDHERSLTVDARRDAVGKT